MPYIRNIWQILPWSNLLNEVLHLGFTVSIKQWTKEKKKMIPFWGKKQEKLNSATTMMSVDGSWNYKGNSLNKDIETRISKKI